MKKIFLPLLALVALASCTQNDMDLKGADDGQVEIKLTQSVGTVTQTRTSYDVLVPTSTDSLEAVVLVSTVPNLYNPDNTTLLNKDSYRLSFKDADPTGFSDGVTGLATPVYYPANGNDVYMWGLYPYGKIVSATPGAGEWQMTAAGSTANYTFTGKEDVMASQEIKSNKGQAVTSVNYKDTKLVFSHFLTKLLVKAKGDEAAKEAFGAITDITLVGVGVATPTSNIKNKIAITLATDVNLVTPLSTPVFSGGLASFPFYAYDVITDPADPKQLNDAFAGLGSSTTPKAFDVPSSTDYPNGQLIAYSMVQPIEDLVGGSTAYLLNVKTEKGETNGFNVPVILKDTSSPAADFAGSTASKTFNIQLTFKAAEIKSIVAVGAWVPQGDFDYDIQ